MQGNQIVDVEPLSKLTNLTILRLDNNDIIDLTPLSNLANLTNNPVPNNTGKSNKNIDDILGDFITMLDNKYYVKPTISLDLSDMGLNDEDIVPL